MRDTLRKLPTETLMRLAAGFGHKPKSGTAALNLLENLPEDKVAAGLAALQESGDIDTTEALSASEAEPVQTQTPKTKPEGTVAVTVKVTRKEPVIYNGVRYSFAAKVPTFCPKHVAEHVCKFFDASGIPYSVKE